MGSLRNGCQGRGVDQEEEEVEEEEEEEEDVSGRCIMHI